MLFMDYLWNMRGYPQFSIWISITLVKIYISRIIINRGKSTFELIGTVLKRDNSSFTVAARVSKTSHA